MWPLIKLYFSPSEFPPIEYGHSIVYILFFIFWGLVCPFYSCNHCIVSSYSHCFIISFGGWSSQNIGPVIYAELGYQKFDPFCNIAIAVHQDRASWQNILWNGYSRWMNFLSRSTWNPKQPFINKCLVKQPFMNRCFRFQVSINIAVSGQYNPVYSGLQRLPPL